MSSVTSFWIIVPDEHRSNTSEERRIREVAKFVHDHLFSHAELTYPSSQTFKTIDLTRDDWESLQSGGKVAGMAGMWFGWNYADPEGLLAALKEFEPASGSVLIWQHENDEQMEVERV